MLSARDFDRFERREKPSNSILPRPTLVGAPFNDGTGRHWIIHGMYYGLPPNQRINIMPGHVQLPASSVGYKVVYAGPTQTDNGGKRLSGRTSRQPVFIEASPIHYNL